MVTRIIALLQREIKVEWRQNYALSGVLLFIAMITFIVYKAFNRFTPMEWLVMLWIIVLFAGLNAIVKSFVQEDAGTYRYYYGLIDPLELVLAKLIYNIALLGLLFLIAVFLMAFFGGNPIRIPWLFWSSAGLGIVGIGTVFTLVSVMSAAGSGSSTLMSIMALPLILPILLTLIKVTADALGLISDSDVDTDLLILGAIDLLMLGLTLILFPLVWKS